MSLLEEAIIQCMGIARWTLDIFTRDLEPHLLGKDAVTEQLKQSILASPKLHVRVLVVDETLARTEGHPWVRLAHRLESRIQFRLPDDDHATRADAFLCADGRTGVHRDLATRPEFTVIENNGRYWKTAMNWFEQAWEFGTVAPGLKRL